MTLPDERYAAIRNTERFLMDLCDARITPRVPRYLRDRARSLLRHYPNPHHLDELAGRSPNIISPNIEQLTRMLMVYEQSLKEKHDDHAS